MSSPSNFVTDERSARALFSMIVEPDDPITGRMLTRLGGVETLRLVESDEPVPGVPRAEVLVWRERLAGRMSADLLARIGDAQQSGFAAIIPTDSEWPAGLDDLGNPGAVCVVGARGDLVPGCAVADSRDDHRVSGGDALR